MAVLMVMPSAIKAQDTVYIGNGNHNNFTGVLPTYTTASYSMTQQLYTAAEIGRAGTIYSITFKGLWYSATRDINVYMVHTNKTSFVNSNDWVPVTTADRVYSGIFAFPGWEITIDLQVPFQYNGTDNLLLVVDDNTGIASGEMLNIECFYASSLPHGLEIHSNDVNYDPTHPGNSVNLTGELRNSKNQIWLGFTSTCPPPTNPTVSFISQTSATLSWTESGSATEWQVCVNGDETNPITVTTNSYTLDGLTPGTDYRVKVRSICGTNNTSQWCNEVIVNTAPDLVEIGFCTGSSHGLLPSSSDSQYSLSEQIYTASEINRTGTISGISFYNAGTTQSRNFDMYIVHTNKSAFDHNLDWISTTPADLVFSGPIELTTGAWTEIALDVPFAYNGTDNILLVMNDKTGSSAPGMSCYTFQTSAIEAIYGYRDGSSYDPMFPHSILGDYNSEKNCVRLNFGTNCTKPANLTVSENGMNSAKLVWDNNGNANSWIVEYSTDSVFSGAIATTVTTDSCLLTGLTPETEYHVRVKADCGADGESYWNVISFFTNSCPIENQCEITYKLGDTYGDGWTGNAINVVDVTSNIVLDTWTIEYGDSASGSLFVCDGREIRFEWVSGYDPNEISYRVYDANGVQILNGVGAFLTPVTYMVNCASSPCPTPGNIAVSNYSGGTVTVSWTENGSATAWQICLDGDEANPISVNTNPYTLSGLDSTVFHNVKVRANCGSDYSFWSSSTSFAKVRSTSNWYAYAQRCPNNDNLRNKLICFSAQDPATATAASDQNPYALAATFVNGEVWFFDEDNTNLYKAPLDNNTKTMGAYETVATNFDGNNNIASMSYNPVDGRIYYILYTPS